MPDLWTVLSGVSFVHQTLLFGLYALGLVLALRRLRGEGRSARLAAVGFGLGVAGAVCGVVDVVGYHFRYLVVPWTEPDPWPRLILTSCQSLASVASTALLVLALWAAWRGRVPSRDGA